MGSVKRTCFGSELLVSSRLILFNYYLLKEETELITKEDTDISAENGICNHESFGNASKTDTDSKERELLARSIDPTNFTHAKI